MIKLVIIIKGELLSLLLSLLMLFCMTSTAFATELPSNTKSTVGVLTIFSSNDGGSSSWNTSGHAFLSFKNSSSSSIVVGGLNIGSNHEITFGTWGNKSQHEGIWYNLESYYVHNGSAYGNRVSLSMSVTQSNIDTINSLISSSDKWSLTNNCSSFATKIWNKVSSISLSAGSPNTPTSLMDSIKSKSNYETGRSLGNTTPIGYVKNGSFISVTTDNFSLYSNYANTTEGFKEFIVPINQNPNSMQ